MFNICTKNFFVCVWYGWTQRVGGWGMTQFVRKKGVVLFSAVTMTYD